MRERFFAGVYVTLGFLLFLFFVPCLPAQTQYDGSWSGTTGQGKPFSFTVSGGLVTTVSFGGTITLTGCTLDFTMSSISLSRPITGSSFSVTRTTSSAGQISYLISGTFTTTTSASGSLSFTQNPGSLSCPGTVNTTWTATKGGATPVPLPIPSATYLTFIPHCVTGGNAEGGYVTRIVVTNLSTSSNSITINTIDQNGQQVGSSRQQQLAAGGTVEISTGETNRLSNQTVQWLAIGSSGPTVATILFDFRYASGPENQTVSAVGVLAQSAGTSFTGPFMYQRDGQATLPVLVKGLGIANRSDQANTITVRLRDQNGIQVSSDTLNSTIQPFGQTAFVPSTLPNMSAFLTGRDTFVGSIVVSGTQAFIPVYLGNMGGRLFSLPLVSSGTGSSAQAPESFTVIEGEL